MHLVIIVVIALVVFPGLKTTLGNMMKSVTKSIEDYNKSVEKKLKED